MGLAAVATQSFVQQQWLSEPFQYTEIGLAEQTTQTRQSLVLSRQRKCPR